MITAKFGGTAITPENLHFVKQLVTPNHNCVVVSAIGKSHPADTKTTDLLKAYYVDGRESLWREVGGRYKQLCLCNSIDIDVEKLLFDAHLNARKHSLCHAMSIGEELSARVVAKYLKGEFVDAERAVWFEKSLDFKSTQNNLKSAFCGLKLGVIGGFYGGSVFGRKTFSRGGSDVTGSLCAVATNATLYENWTDVNGVCQANPLQVDSAKTLCNLSYQQMYLLAKVGASVLHPQAVKPLQKMAIPLKIGNFYNPNAPSTLVSNLPNLQKLLCVTQNLNKNLYRTTVVHNLSFEQVSQCLQSLCKKLQQSSCHNANVICNITLKSHCVSILSTTSILQQTFCAFQSCNLR